MVRVHLLVTVALHACHAADDEHGSTTCGDVKDFYKEHSCCGAPSKEIPHLIVPGPDIGIKGINQCAGKKPTGEGWDNFECVQDGVMQAIEQSGSDVSDDAAPEFNSNATAGMITTAYYKNGLCPVNVHWHLGTEHRSLGEYDESGTGPGLAGTPSTHDPNRRLQAGEGDDARRLAGEARYGYACSKYNDTDPKFTTPYNWHHCEDMHVGETYEVHWPHSALGACGTPDQYQYPFYDGVFCGYNGGALTQEQVAGAVGVQAQVFTIVNDESYYYPDLMRGMIVDSSDGNDFGQDMAFYTGSTTGTSRNNVICSAYAPITWQVDRKCHLISASSFDKMCADMKQQRDDMSDDRRPHGSRVLVSRNMSADNLQFGSFTIPR